MGCGCGGSPQVWQPAGQTQQQAQDANGDPNERIQAEHQAQAARRVWPRAWDGRREPEKV